MWFATEDEDLISTGSFGRPILEDDDDNFFLLRIDEVIDFLDNVVVVLKAAVEVVVARNRWR